MIVALHADAGSAIGLGHASRCCGLALALRRINMIPVMLNAAESALTPLFTEMALPELRCDTTPAAIAAAARRAGAKLLVTDSYRLDRLELRQASQGLKLAWFDDTAEQPMAADVIVNGSPAALSLPYDLPAAVVGLLGPAYQILRPGLRHRHRAGPVRRLLVTYGGADPMQVGPRLAASLPDHLEVDFVVGPFAPVPDNLPANARLHHAPHDLTALIDAADLAICAGGQTLYELAASGCPIIAIGIGADQKPTLDWLYKDMVIAFAGWAADADLQASLRHILTALLEDDERRLSMARTALTLIDGQGAERVAAALKTLMG